MSDVTFQSVAAIIYTIAWSVSFYGQIYQNWKQKSVQGFSMNYLVMNICGYTYYALYSSIGYFTDIQGAGTVVTFDLIYAYHAMFCVVIEGIQSIIYPRGKNKISKFTIFFCIFLWGFNILEIFFTIVIRLIPWTQFYNPVSCLGYSKLALSLIKCLPAMYWNYRRKSTKGWSIHMILLDFTGGLLSLISGQISTQHGLNITKLGLGILTVVYDIIFITQHFILYRKPKQKLQLQDQNQKRLIQK